MKKLFKLACAALLALAGMAGVRAQSISWYSQIGATNSPSYTVTAEKGVEFVDVKIDVGEGNFGLSEGKYVVLRTFKADGEDVATERDTIWNADTRHRTGFCQWDAKSESYYYFPGFATYEQAEVMYSYILPSGSYKLELTLMKVGADGALTAVEGAAISHSFTVDSKVDQGNDDSQVGTQSNLELPSDYKVTMIAGAIPKVKFSWKYVEGQQGQVRVFNNADMVIWSEGGEQEVLWEDMTAEQFEEIKDMTLRWELRAVKYDAEDFTKLVDSTSWINCGEFVPGQQLGSDLELPDGLSWQLGYGASDPYAYIFFRWTKPRGEQYCQVYIYDADNKFVGKCQGQLGKASFDYENAHFPAGTYSWKIRGVEFADDAITVLDSTEWVEATGKDVTTTTDYSTSSEELAAPTDLQAAVVGTDGPAAINFKWKGDNTLFYEIEIYKDNAPTATLTRQSFGEAMWPLPETGYQGNYDWRIRAVTYTDADLTEVGSASEWVDGKRITIGDVWIPAPANLDAEVNGTKATLSWDAKKGLYYDYVIMLNDNPVDMGELDPLSDDGRMTYTTRDLSAGTYSWVVYASDIDYNYSQSVEGPAFTIKTGDDTPGDVPAPANLAVNVTDDELLFSWDAKAGCFYAGYITDDAGTPVGMIMYPRSGGLMEEDGRVEVGYPLDLVLEQVCTTDGIYHWSLQAFNANYDESDEVAGPDFYVSNGGISVSCEKSVLAGLNLYPNPTTGEFTLNVPVRADVAIFGLDGKWVESRYSVEGSVRFALNRAGIYMVRVTAGNTVAVKKVIVK